MVVFGIHRFQSATGAHVSPHPEPHPPTFLLTPSLWGFECSASCIELGLVIYFTYGNIHVSMLFSQIILLNLVWSSILHMVIYMFQCYSLKSSYWTWTGHLFYIWWYTCFNAILSNHPTLAFSHRVQKSVLYICFSFVVLHIGLSLPSF